MQIVKHFVVTAYIVYEDKVLLHFHKKLNMWLAVGGHIEENELPEEALMREVAEETGLSVKLHVSGKPLGISDVEQLNNPVYTLLEDIAPGHQHIDMIYFATAETDKLEPHEGESMQMKWFSVDDLMKLDSPDNVRAISLEAIKLLSK